MERKSLDRHRQKYSPAGLQLGFAEDRGDKNLQAGVERRGMNRIVVGLEHDRRRRLDQSQRLVVPAPQFFYALEAISKVNSQNIEPSIVAGHRSFIRAAALQFRRGSRQLRRYFSASGNFSRRVQDVRRVLVSGAGIET